MNESELKIRVVFASAAVVALCAAVTNLVAVLALSPSPWSAFAVPVAAFVVAAIEALGLRKVAAAASVRLLVSVVMGVACLASLQN